MGDLSKAFALAEGAERIGEERIEMHDHCIVDAADALGGILVAIVVSGTPVDTLEPSQPWFELRGDDLFYCVMFGAENAAEWRVPRRCWRMRSREDMN